METGRTEGIILSALLLITQYGVGLVDEFELLLRLLIPSVSIRVILQGELSVSPLDLLLAGVLVNAQYLVIVLIFHPLPSVPSRAECLRCKSP